MRFIERKLSNLTVAACDAELKRAKAAHATYANAIRATKRLIETRPDLGDMGDADSGAAEEKGKANR